jgi:signal transduction histidine kinase
VDSWNRLARVLTHEIMNAVTPIASLSETLLSTGEELTPTVRNGLDVIRSTGRGLLSFVESYRRFMHLPQPQPLLFYVRPFAERMVQLAMHRLPSTNVTLTAEVEPDDLILYADEGLVGQVVSNLLKNALQAIGSSRPDGRICLRARSSEDESVVLEVSNNGPVIPPDEAQHIFVPFYTTKRGGSGIGLSVARQIMRLSGGSIELVHTPPPLTTTFVLTFS